MTPGWLYVEPRPAEMHNGEGWSHRLDVKLKISGEGHLQESYRNAVWRK